MLKDQKQFDSYVARGESEIHWGEKKVSHFTFLRNLLGKNQYKHMVIHSIERVIQKFDVTAVKSIIVNVDNKLPISCSLSKIPEQRKELICKLVFSRFNNLKALV